MDNLTLSNHPAYDYDISEIQKITDFIDGSKRATCVPKYIYRYMTEDASAMGKSQYANRLQISYNVNLVAPFLEIHHAHLSQPIVFGGVAGTENGDAFLADASGYGDSAETMAREWTWWYMAHGRAGMLIDAPMSVSATQAQRIANNERTFQIMYRAEHILFWEYFRNGPKKGKFSKLLLQEDPEVTTDGKVLERAIYFYFKPDAKNYFWAKLEKASESSPTDKGTVYKVLSEGEGSIEFIPFVLLGRGLEDSFARQNVEYNVAYLNKLSVRTNINYNQGFQRAAIAGDVDPAQLKSMHEGQLWVIRTQNNNVTLLIIPAGDPTAITQELAELTLLCVKHGLLLSSTTSSESKQVSSYESKAFDAKNRVAEYDRVLTELEEALTELYQYRALLEGESPDDVNVQIARDYELDDPAAMMLENQVIASLARAVGVTEVEKEILKGLLPRIELHLAEGENRDEKLAKLVTAVDSASPLEIGSFPFGTSSARASIVDSV